jgi:bifunctional DNA-binding transcriptional regulator/antitoxin component of YhaV-PrlF toxin-antitoxin module
MTTLTMSKRGTITIPPEMRRHLGLDKMSHPLLLVEERDGGLFLQPASAVPVRNIARETIESWLREDESDMKAIRARKRR